MNFSLFSLSVILGMATFLVGISKGATPQIDVDTSEAPDLKEFGQRVKKACTDWYPRVAKYLYSSGYQDPAKIRIKFDPNDNGVAGTDAFNAYIQGGAKYFREHKDDVGAMVHEMTHVVQRYKKCEGWFTEGVADLVRWFWYEPVQKRPGKPNSKQSYRDGYGVSAYFLDFVDRKVSKGRTAIQQANKNCRDGNYNDQSWKQVTGMTLDELWNKMQKEG